MSDLPEFDVTIMMKATIDGEPQTRPFRLRLPCRDEQHARSAAVQLGFAVNEGSGYLWKLTEDVDVREVRRDR